MKVRIPKPKVSKALGLASDLKNKSGRSASRALLQATLTFCLILTVQLMISTDYYLLLIQSVWRTKVGTMRQQALKRAEGAEES